MRYEGQFLNYITGKNNFSYATLANNKYVVLYSVGYEVFKKHPFFGVGNKNFRIELSRLTLKIIESGMKLLGINMPDRM